MIDATPCSPTANSYGTLAEADAYLASTYGADAWAALDDADPKREQLAITATRELDQLFPYLPGSVTSPFQRLRWPRVGVVTADGRIVPSAEVPELLKEAQFELMLAMAGSGSGGSQSELIQQLKTLGIESGKVGPLSFKFSSSATVGSEYGSSLPERVLSKLRLLSMYLPSPSSSGSLPVIRC